MQKKAFDKIQPFHVKNTQIRNRRQLSQNDKAIYEKPTINIISMASGPTTSWQIVGETVETVADFILGGAPKSLQMVTAAMKLKNAYSLEGKL